MNDRIRNLTVQMEKTDGAAEQSLETLRTHFGVKLPAEYLEFTRTTNGADGPIGSVEYLQIWPAEEIIQLDLLRVDLKEEHPEWLFFGGTGSGSNYAFDTRYQPMPVVEVDMIDPDSNEVRGALSRSF